MKHFKEPQSKHRPISFWSLNDKLEKDELLRQIDTMKEAGWGGFFFHARGGLVTPYMEKEWLECLCATVEKAKKENMHAWLYDENCWPSGTAGHTIAKLDKSFRETHLFCSFDRPAHTPDCIEEMHVYRAECGPAFGAKNYRRTDLFAPIRRLAEITEKEAQAPLGEAERLVYIYVWRAPACNPRFGGVSYVDLMNPNMTRAFIDSTHEKYKAVCGDAFGKAVPGIFTDDITIKWDLYGMKRNAVPWTGALPEIFKARFGYALTLHLPDLFFDTETATKTRADYIKVINELFAENFVGVISEWCEENGMALTGHLMGNEGLYSDVMYQFYLMHYPATDHLSDALSGFTKHRRAASVAHQFGKEKVLCELYGGAGHELSFVGQRRLSDFLAIAGVTQLVPHISQYSMRGMRKRDHPPAFSYQNPAWKYTKPLSDYQARLSVYTSETAPIADVLFLDPIEGKYITAACYGSDAEQKRIIEYFSKTEEILLQTHVGFEYGSEYLLSRFGKAENGKLYLGNAQYRTVIVPYTVSLRQSTLRLLEAFAKQGGEVIVVGNLPALCDGESNGACQTALACAKVVPLQRLFDLLCQKGLSLTDEEGNVAIEVMLSVRRGEDASYALLLNRNERIPQMLTLSLEGENELSVLSLADGTSAPIYAQFKANKTIASIRINAGGSLLLSWKTVENIKNPFQNTEKTAPCTPFSLKNRFVLSKEWSLEADELNALVLDRFARAENGEPFGKIKEVTSLPVGTGFTLRTTFHNESWSGNAGKLAVECAENWNATLNGKSLPLCEGWYKDLCMGLFDISEAVREGENELLLSVKEGKRCDCESVFLLGNFSVYTEDGIRFLLKDGALRIFKENLTDEGMPFYGGNVILSKTFDLAPAHGSRYALRIGAIEGATAYVTLNGKLLRPTFETPYLCDITDALRCGQNRLEIHLIGTLRNLYGPHHFISVGNPPFVTPGLYGDPKSFTQIYHLIPFGIKNVSIDEI